MPYCNLWRLSKTMRFLECSTSRLFKRFVGWPCRTQHPHCANRLNDSATLFARLGRRRSLLFSRLSLHRLCVEMARDNRMRLGSVLRTINSCDKGNVGPARPTVTWKARCRYVSVLGESSNLCRVAPHRAAPLCLKMLSPVGLAWLRRAAEKN
jgi:hypothetical protein